MMLQPGGVKIWRPRRAFFSSLFSCFLFPHFLFEPVLKSWKFDPDTEIYIGPTKRSFVPIEERTPSAEGPKPISHSGWVSLNFFLEMEMVVIATDWLTLTCCCCVCIDACCCLDSSTHTYVVFIEFRRERCLQRSRGRNCKTVGSGDFARGSHEFYVPYIHVYFFLSPNQIKIWNLSCRIRLIPDPLIRMPGNR